VLFLVDCNPSMTQNKLAHVKERISLIHKYHIQEADDLGIMAFDDTIRTVVKIMPKHVINLQAQLECVPGVPQQKRKKRRLFDALRKAHHDLNFRKIQKEDKKEQYIVLFTDYKGTSVDQDNDADCSAEEHARVKQENESREIFEDSSPGGEQQLLDEVSGKVTGGHAPNVTLILVHVTEDEGEAGAAERSELLENSWIKQTSGYTAVYWFEMTQDAVHNGVTDPKTGCVEGCKKLWKEEVNTTWDFMRHLHMETFI